MTVFPLLIANWTKNLDIYTALYVYAGIALQVKNLLHELTTIYWQNSLAGTFPGLAYLASNRIATRL